MLRRYVENERGGVLVFVAVGMLLVLIMVGLAIDSGRGFIRKAHLGRAVDASALTAAKALRQGESVARRRALVMAEANGVGGLASRAQVSVGFGTNAFGERTVTVSAQDFMPTLLMRLIGQEIVGVKAAAVAAVPPVDMVLVLDQSGSLGMANAFDDLQAAAKEFVGNFDDQIDQVSLVSFNMRAETRFDMGQPFTNAINSEIDNMTSVSYTNTGEALRHAYDQFQGGAIRQRSVKVVVFFTDGQPTAARAPVGGSDRVIAAWTGNRVAGFWNNPDQVPMTYIPRANGCRNAWSCYGWTFNGVFAGARQNGLDNANLIRGQEIVIYTIGLGDTSRPASSILQPDQDYLRQIANVGGMTDPDQPKGKMYFAPSAVELQLVFRLVAEDLLARLTL